MSTRGKKPSSEEGESPAAVSGRRWSEFEKSTLIELIEAKKTTVEDKHSDFGTVTKKAKAWEEITREFGSTTGCFPRKEKQLRDWWKNAKARAKSEVTKTKKSMRKTGGGPPEGKLSEEAQRVVGVVPAQMTSLKNPYDCDGDLDEMNDENELLLNVTPTSSPPRSDSTTVSVEPPINKTGEVLLNEEPPSKRMKLPAKSTQLKDARHAIVQMEEEEHKIRLDTLRIENEVAKAKLAKIKLETSALQEEHSLRMEIMRQNQTYNVPPSSWNSKDAFTFRSYN